MRVFASYKILETIFRHAWGDYSISFGGCEKDQSSDEAREDESQQMGPAGARMTRPRRRSI